VLLALVVVAVAACGGDDDDTGGTDDRGAGSDNPLIGPTWQWQEASGGEQDLAPDDPSLYTLSFNDDGTANIQADCNQVVASYSIDETLLTIEPGPSTMAACPEGSLSDQYIRLLSAASSYTLDGEELEIALFDDAGTMTFTS
jgi:heat shock protein HslJ